MCEQIRNGRLSRLYQRELLRIDIALCKRDFTSVDLHLKRASRFLKAMDFSFMKGQAA